MDRDEKKLIRSSTAEFLIFTAEGGEETIEVRYEDETIWASQKMMAALFGVTIPTINEHLKNIYEGGELTREATIWKFRIVQIEGGRKVTRIMDRYNLDAIISGGYRLNSKRATQFRQWATQVLRELLSKAMCSGKRMNGKLYRDVLIWNKSFMENDWKIVSRCIDME